MTTFVTPVNVKSKTEHYFFQDYPATHVIVSAFYIQLRFGVSATMTVGAKGFDHCFSTDKT